MDEVSAFFASGHAADLILAVLAAEFVWLVMRGGKPLDVALALGPAVFIVIALRGALTGADWPLIALPLMLSFPVHIADLMRRGMLSKST
ncbi:MAG: hypothetical protein KYX66_01755 [Blastomonas fulva]|uniref:hypothetical protein n=1 Tax=Blastomonas fulva TaxID=1550728 RepID=UPI0024E1CE77|nr:hypothetical protein [Blastomonas fulva]MDK2755440.1 hypothetical protein [Blastomonas fulva]